jgi:hypothetical protein
MKKLTLIAIAGASALAVAAWSVPASAGIVAEHHDKKPESHGLYNRETTTSVPEPGTMALLALGLGAMGLAPLRRRRKD